MYHRGTNYFCQQIKEKTTLNHRLQRYNTMKLWGARLLVYHTIILLLITCFIYSSAFNHGFQNHRFVSKDCKILDTCQSHHKRWRQEKTIVFTSYQDDDGTTTSSKNYNPIDQNLIRPPINIRKESILFGDNPATAKNNNISRLWKTLKQRLPYALTGVSKNNNDKSADDNPIGKLYNMIFVRFPTLVAGLFYSKNLVEGHPLYCDIGYGLMEVPPLFVYGVLLIILR